MKSGKARFGKNNPTARKIGYLSGMKDKACWTEPVTWGPSWPPYLYLWGLYKFCKTWHYKQYVTPHSRKCKELIGLKIDCQQFISKHRRLNVDYFQIEALAPVLPEFIAVIVYGV